MLYFKTDETGNVIGTSHERPEGTYITRHDFKSLQDAERVADGATKATGKLHIATDETANTSPRYDVILAPAVGDEVSQAFNGDYYPRGKIIHVSRSLKKITTDTDHVFWRYKNTATWLVNGYASMVRGHHSKLNPSF